MDNDMKLRVTYLLETYQERQRKIALLHYELEHPAHTSEAEMINAMALATVSAAAAVTSRATSLTRPSISPSTTRARLTS